MAEFTFLRFNAIERFYFLDKAFERHSKISDLSQFEQSVPVF